MVRNFLEKSSGILARQQTNVLSAATVIMVMIAASRLLGLVRNRILAQYFSAETLSVYFAAFRLPEVIFEILVFGTLSAAFIPTFTSYISKKDHQQAWYIAAVSVNLALLFFLPLALLIFIFADRLYQVLTPGFTPAQVSQVANLTRILIWVQGFFVISYFLTGVLESFQRFLIPAIAPLFYNLGIIGGTMVLAPAFGIYAPTVGAAIGAFLHFFIQLPLALHLGFRPQRHIDINHPGVREVGQLAFPRIIELTFLQIGKTAELFLASLISAAAYTHYTFANSLQLLPIGLFGTSIAKASLPTLSSHSARGENIEFSRTLSSLFTQILFLVVPCSVFLIILRIPVVRLAFGAARFTWESTLQTSFALSAFCLGIFPQALVYLLTRAFYALHDTLTPVKISILSIFIDIFLGAIFVFGFHLPVWSLALAYSLASLSQFLILSFFLFRRLPLFRFKEVAISAGKIFAAAGISGLTMYLLLKIFDQSVWNKQLSFLGRLGMDLPTSFDRFVLDTRYTVNLLILTIAVGVVGLLMYLLLCWALKVRELSVVLGLIKKFSGLGSFRARAGKEKEPITVVNGN